MSFIQILVYNLLQIFMQIPNIFENIIKKKWNLNIIENCFTY